MRDAPTLLPAASPTADIVRELDGRAERQMLSPARQRGYELRLLGATVLPQRQVITRTQWGTWLFVDHANDPTARQFGGKIPVPADQKARLEALHQAGVEPDLIWLAHQLPDTWREGDNVPVPAPRHLREKDQRLAEQLRVATKLFVRGAGMVLTAAAAAPLAVVGAVAGAGLDPLVLGGVRHPELPLVQWALLAQWEWE